MKNRLVGLILAAGEGTRFKSEIPKVLHHLLGKSLLRLTLEAVGDVRPAGLIVVAGPGKDRVTAEVEGTKATIIEQKTGKGTSAAVRAARKELVKFLDGDVLVLPADIPLIRSEVLQALVSRHRKRRSACTILSAEVSDPRGFGRIIHGDEGHVRIIEDRDAAPTVRILHEVNTSIYIFRVVDLLRVLPRITNANRAGEYSLADAVTALSAAGHPVDVFLTPDPEDILQISTRYDLGRAADLLRLRKIRTLAETGVTILSPATTWIDLAVTIGPETVVYPGVVIEGPTVIGRNGRIYPGAHIVNAVIGDDVQVLSSTVIEEATVENDVRIGPFARVRMKTRLRTGSRVGNFVEMKNTDFGAKSKAMHLSYLGDSEIGEEVNIGAGTITCNFDGLRKNRTIIGAGAFIGSGSELIAPVRIGRGAYVAAGSVITADVADDALAIARGRQVEKPGWAAAQRAQIRAAEHPGPKITK